MSNNATNLPDKILIVAGGLSRRMGQDKSQIEIQGSRQIERLLELAQNITSEVLVSTNEPDKIPAGIPTLADIHPDAGPLAALEAFHVKHPDQSVLLLGCDLFLLDEETVRHLISQRQTSKEVTAFANRVDGRAEPLCTIYEPQATAKATKAIADDRKCARHFVEELDNALLELRNPVALDGANTPEELKEVRAKIEYGVTKKSVKILYFAKLREERGLHEEAIETLACTAGGLYEEMRFRHRLSLKIDALRCARNGEFCDWNTLLQTNDEIVFIPPVAGG